MANYRGRGRPPKKPKKLGLQSLTALLSQGDSNHPTYQSKQSLSSTIPINEKEVLECLQPKTLKRKRGRPRKIKKGELLLEKVEKKEEEKRPKVRVIRIITAPDPDATDSSSDEGDDKQRWVTRSEVLIQQIRIPVDCCSSEKKKRKMSESGKFVFPEFLGRKRSRRAIKRTVVVPSYSSPLSDFEVPGPIPDFVELITDTSFLINFFADVPED